MSHFECPLLLPKKGQWPVSAGAPLHLPLHDQQGNPVLPGKHLKPSLINEHFNQVAILARTK